MRSVLVIDDDRQVLGMLDKAFHRAGYAVATASTGQAALDTYARDAADLVILDLGLPDVPGLELLGRLRTLDPDATVIVLTGRTDLPTAVDAMRAGAENFLPKPVSVKHLYAAADRAFEKIDLRSRTAYLERRSEDPGGENRERESPMMRAVADKVELVAPTDTTVLLLGETGTGKNRLARRIHALSRRASGPFVEVNCASLTATFLESELFGHEKGAFTDARTMKRGLFEVAHNGTLFLDEIGDLAPELQPKLLRALESRRFRRLGGTRDLSSDVRLIAATNHDLQRDVAANRFREDLYYRIAVMPIHLPALRTWDRADREHLAGDLLHDLGAFKGPAARSISPEALHLIASYPWPGNIREMRNVLERALILSADGGRIEPGHLPAEVARAASRSTVAAAPSPDITLEELERAHIIRVLEHCRGNRSQAARTLGISRVGLYKKLRRFGIQRDAVQR